MPMSANVQRLIEPAIAVLGFELVSCKFISESGRRTLQVLIDAPAGVSVDDCSHASRQINAILDAEAAISEAYDLEVSSPGLDRPLVTPAHYQRFIGNQVAIKLRQPEEGRRRLTGQLLAATEQEITLMVDDKTTVILFDQIETANLVPDLRF